MDNMNRTAALMDDATCERIAAELENDDFAPDALNTLILDGRVRIMMRSLSSRTRANGGYVYEAVSNG